MTLLSVNAAIATLDNYLVQPGDRASNIADGVSVVNAIAVALFSGAVMVQALYSTEGIRKFMLGLCALQQSCLAMAIGLVGMLAIRNVATFRQARAIKELTSSWNKFYGNADASLETSDIARLMKCVEKVERCDAANLAGVALGALSLAAVEGRAMKAFWPMANLREPVALTSLSMLGGGITLFYAVWGIAAFAGTFFPRKRNEGLRKDLLDGMSLSQALEMKRALGKKEFDRLLKSIPRFAGCPELFDQPRPMSVEEQRANAVSAMMNRKLTEENFDEMAEFAEKFQSYQVKGRLQDFVLDKLNKLETGWLEKGFALSIDDRCIRRALPALEPGNFRTLYEIANKLKTPDFKAECLAYFKGHQEEIKEQCLWKIEEMPAELAALLFPHPGEIF